MAKDVTLTINNISVTVPEGTTILQAARKAHIEIPTLCYLKDVSCVGSCRMCVVEATGARGLVAACVYPDHGVGGGFVRGFCDYDAVCEG